MGFFDRLFGPPATPAAADPAQPAMTRGPRLDRVMLHVIWATPGEISREQPGTLGFTRGPELLGDGEYHAWLTVPQPADFNDFPRLKTLGHEVLHSLGATHEKER